MPTLETAAPKPVLEPAAGAVTQGTLVALLPSEEAALVIYPGQPGAAALRARATVDLRPDQVGAAVALLFENGDPTRPIVVGSFKRAAALAADDASIDVTVDEQRLIVSASTQIVLRCGKASIVLTSAGKIILRGTYITSESTGVHRIRGGSVQIN